MKRKFLEDLGLEKEAIDKIMAENGNDINTAKTECEALKQQLETMKQQISERDTQLEKLKENTGENKTLQQQIIDLQAENKTTKEKYEADLKELQLSSAIKLAIGSSAQDGEIVASLFDRSKLILGEDGTVSGLEEQLNSIKKEKAFLFKEEQPTTTLKGGKPAEGNGAPPTTKKPSEMTYSELCAYMEANPGANIE